MKLKIKNYRFFFVAIFIAFISVFATNPASSQIQLFDLGKKVKTRSISFENQTGEAGKGGMASNKNLGVGRKGSHVKRIMPGEEFVLCEIVGSGTIRHIWMTGTFRKDTEALRSMVLRGYWEKQQHPSIECPLGDFMGVSHAKINAYQSAIHSVGEHAALNFWLPMPFSNNAKLTITNESDQAVSLYYQIDYTIGEKHPKNLGCLHVCFRRENPTILKKDFEILPKRTGKGKFIGVVLGVRTLQPGWWGEGEMKVYMDGDTDFPTICGTGTEDYICQSYGIQQTPYLYHGCSWNNHETKWNKDEFFSLYRWHVLDPIYWEKECRITIQQIGQDNAIIGKYERQDDWSCASFWYEAIPSERLPELPNKQLRIENLWKE